MTNLVSKLGEAEAFCALETAAHTVTRQHALQAKMPPETTDKVQRTHSSVPCRIVQYMQRSEHRPIIVSLLLRTQLRHVVRGNSISDGCEASVSSITDGSPALRQAEWSLGRMIQHALQGTAQTSEILCGRVCCQRRALRGAAAGVANARRGPANERHSGVAMLPGVSQREQRHEVAEVQRWRCWVKPAVDSRSLCQREL